MSISNEFAEALVDDLRHQKSVVERLSGERDTLQSKLTEMEQCLSWASENVVSAMGPIGADPTWTATTMEHHFDAPTLYAALKSAWEGCDK